MKITSRGLLSHRRRRWIVAALLGSHAAMLAWSASRQAPTIDEPVHLAAGVHHWKTESFELNRGNPPLANLIAATPVLLADPKLDFHRVPDSFEAGGDFLAANGSRSFWLVTLARWALIPMSLLGAWVCYVWAGRLYGRAAGLLTLALWCFCPFVIANGELITGDMTSASMSVAAAYCFWRWLRIPSWKRAVVAGAILGAAELSKFVCLFLYPLCGVSWILWRLTSDSRRGGLGKEVLQGVCMLVISVYVINVGYLFDKSFQPLRGYRIGQMLLGEKIDPSRVPPGSKDVSQTGWLGEIPVPLPFDYVKGIEEIQDVFKRTPSIYVRETWLDRAPWWYFPYGYLVKMPLGTLALFSIAAALLIGGRRFSARPKDEFVLAIFGVGLLEFIAFTTTLPYVRYGLPVIPFALIWTGRVGRAFSLGPGVLQWVVSACLLWSAAATYSIFPHSGSYFHELAGGPGEGHRQFIESSIDWGQDLLYLKEWLDAHPEARPLRFAYFGRIDPRLAGIEFSPPPLWGRSDAPDEAASMPPLEPGFYAVSVSLLRGFRWYAVPDGKGGTYSIREIGEFDYLKGLPLAGRAGYSIYIFQVEDDKGASR